MGNVIRREEGGENFFTTSVLCRTEAERLAKVLLPKDVSHKCVEDLLGHQVSLDSFCRLYKEESQSFVAVLLEVLLSKLTGKHRKGHLLKKRTSSFFHKSEKTFEKQLRNVRSRLDETQFVTLSDALSIAGELLIDPNCHIEESIVEAALLICAHHEASTSDDLTQEFKVLCTILSFIHIELTSLFQEGKDIYEKELTSGQKDEATFCFEPWLQSYAVERRKLYDDTLKVHRHESQEMTSHLILSWMSKVFTQLRTHILMCFRVHLSQENDPSNTLNGTTSAYNTNMSAEHESNQEELREAISMFPKRSNSVMQLQNISNGLRGQFLLSQSHLVTDELCCALLLNMSVIGMSFTSAISPWVRLFASWTSGLSFSRLVSSIVTYQGPTVLVFRSTEDHIFGAYVKTGWKESNGRFCGTGEEFLFTVNPKFDILRCAGVGQSYIYLNSKNKSSPKGLGFGGQVECFRLWIPDEFSESYSTSMDSTYETGLLVEKVDTEKSSFQGFFKTQFNVCEVEVWGCGNQLDFRNQYVSNQTAEMVRMERRKVDKSRLVDNEFDKEYLLGSNFSKAHGVRSADT